MRMNFVRLALGSALAVAFTMSSAYVASGDVRADCERKLEADRARIDVAAAKHGENSPEVGRQVDRMENDRRWCREHKAEWNHDRFDVGIYIRR
jgi:hypothetical protein